MLRSVFRTTQFKKDFKALLKKHYNPDKLRQAIDTLMGSARKVAHFGSWPSMER